MNTELEVLKIIFQGKDITPVSSISNSLGFGTDYIRLICRSLARRNLIRVFKRDWYMVTPKGKRELEKRGFLKRGPRRKGLKMKSSVWQVVKMKEAPGSQPSKNIKLKSEFKKPKDYNPPATQKLKIGEKIEKVASFLGKLRIS